MVETSLITLILVVNLRFPIKLVHFFGQTRLTLDFVAVFLEKKFFELGTSDEDSEGLKDSIGKRV